MSNLTDLFHTYASEPTLLAEHVEYTARQTGFRPELVEKDYQCTVVLHALFGSGGAQLVFKGGTCLSKAFGKFYRLSEYLDLVIPVPPGCTRPRRKELAAPAKRLCNSLPRLCPGIDVGQALRGANESTQYLGTLTYRSVLSGRDENIKLEIGLREPLLKPAENRALATLLMDNITGAPAVAAVDAQVMNLTEMYAEKTRAALNRREPAIRDFFDLDFAVRELGLALEDDTFVDLVAAKLAVPGNEAVDVSAERHAQLAHQVEARLKPVLRHEDFERFDLERSFDAVARLAERLTRRSPA
jgi:predicted nucleotidyltransferase component of viral defense system